MSGDYNMNYYLSDILTGINEEYFIKNDSNNVLEQFCCEPNLDFFHNPTIVETSLSFLTKLNLFPLYIHVISFGYPSNISSCSKNTQEIDNNYFYTVKKIQDFSQLKGIYPKVVSDTNNGETVVITSEERLRLIEPEQPSDIFKYELNFDLSNREILFLVIQLDGECWDFISNFKNHPFKNLPIHDEN